MQQIIIVEDDQIIREELQIFLSKYGYEIKAPTEFNNIVDYILKQNADLILLDINLPVFDGYFICREIRKTSEVPIIVVTSRDSEVDELMSMNLGADDYLAKPFNPLELVARVKSQLRRYMQLGGGSVRPDVIRVGGIELDDKEKRVTLDGEPVALTPTEYDILKLLMQNPGQVFSPREIYSKIWNDLPLGSENTVAVHIRHLREKLEINPAEPRYLKVVWGQGYKCEKQG